MSDISKGIGTIWGRLFDHRGFIFGEVSLILNRFEVQNGDKEVDNLFKTIENITEINDTQIGNSGKFKQAVQITLPRLNNQLEGALDLYQRIIPLETKYKESDHLQVKKLQRKQDLGSFMDFINTSYTEINTITENRKDQLKVSIGALQK